MAFVVVATFAGGLEAFLFFPPAGVTGTLIAYGGDGTKLAEATICPVTSVAGTCAGEVTQLA